MADTGTIGTIGRRTSAGNRLQIVMDGPRVELVGDFDARSTSQVRPVLHGAMAVHERVVVDLAGVANVDLTALRVLAAASRRAHHEGRHLVLASPRPVVVRLMHLSHLARLLEVERLAVPA